MKKPKSPSAYVKDHPVWSVELNVLRSLLLETELVETIKWGIPVYTIGGKNVIGLAGFKNKYGLWFYQGCFLSDPDRLLVNAQEGKTKGMRHIYFQDKEVDAEVISSYIAEAIANQKAGKEIKSERKKVVLSDELEQALKNDPGLSRAYDKLSKSKQAAYAEYIATAKRAATKESRLEKIIPLIKRGEGLNDKYK